MRRENFYTLTTFLVSHLGPIRFEGSRTTWSAPLNWKDKSDAGPKRVLTPEDDGCNSLSNVDLIYRINDCRCLRYRSLRGPLKTWMSRCLPSFLRRRPIS